MWHDLLAGGIECGLHAIERLMRRNGLRARPRRRRLPIDIGDRPAAATLGKRARPPVRCAGAQPQMGGRLHLLWTAEGWLYVAAVLDLFSRRVVGWSMSATMTAELVTDALVMAIWRRGRPKELLHHSDRGSQYTSEAFQRLMAEHGVTCSISRSGNVWDNAAMESFFSSLKVERVARKTYRTRDQARADVFDYIERFYNPRRRHSTPIPGMMVMGQALTLRPKCRHRHPPQAPNCLQPFSPAHQHQSRFLTMAPPHGPQSTYASVQVWSFCGARCETTVMSGRGHG